MEFGTSIAVGTLDDTASIRDEARLLEEGGLDFLTIAGHVLSAELGRFPDRPPGTYSGAFRDPFVLFSNLAAVTSRIGFRTGILILPMFPTVLVAKQSAELALISGNRFALGVGISWHEAEYQAFGQDLHERGARLEEQLEVLKLLWSEEFVTFHGKYHDIDALGLGQLPRPPVPIWIGSSASPALLSRVVRHGNGWLAAGGLSSPEPAQTLRDLASQAGRDPASIEIGGRLLAGPGGRDQWLADATTQQSYGATSLSIAPPPDLERAAGLARVIEARAVLADELGS